MTDSQPVYKRKKVPCEECRYQKRKCNCQQPCERCEQFGIECVYKNIRSPQDVECVELAKQADLLSQIENLNSEINSIETVMNQIKENSPIPSSPSLTDDTDSSTLSDHTLPYITSFNNVDDENTMLVKTQPYVLFESEHNDVCAYLASATKEIIKENKQRKVSLWSMTLRKGQISIQTNVKNHSDLMDNLYHMLQTAELTTQVPPLFTRFTHKDMLLSHLRLSIRKKYGSVYCRNVARSVHIFISPSHVDSMILSRPPDTINTTTMKLIRAYFRCLHLKDLVIHAKTFIRLFVENNHVAVNSSATMALCAAICTMRCKHVADCLPSISLVEYGNFYFEQAHNLVSEMFDQCNLETLTTYIFMMSYKLAISQYTEAKVYTDLAERMAVVLAPQYKYTPEGDLKKQGEAVHFSRLRNYLHRIRTYQQVTVSYDPLLDKSIKRLDLVFSALISRSEGQWDVSEDDALQEKWFAKMHTYIIQFQRLHYEASQKLSSTDFGYAISSSCHQVEMAIRHWYLKILPPEFRLSLPLFDSAVSPSEFFTTLERECAHSAIPALTTLLVYEEWIIMGQSYMPKISTLGDSWSDLPLYWNGGKTSMFPVSKKWEARIRKLNDIRVIMGFEGNDQEFFDTVWSMFTPGKQRLDKKVILMNLYAAFNTVQLVQFLRSRSTDCYFDIRYLINAWQILLRVSRLRGTMEPEVQALVPRIHEHLSLCMLIVREEIQLQPYQGKMGEYVAIMEKDLKNEVEDDDDDEFCDCSAQDLSCK